MTGSRNAAERAPGGAGSRGPARPAGSVRHLAERALPSAGRGAAGGGAVGGGAVDGGAVDDGGTGGIAGGGSGNAPLVVALGALVLSGTTGLDAVRAALGRTVALATAEHVLVLVGALAVATLTHRLAGRRRRAPRHLGLLVLVALGAPLLDAGATLPESAEGRTALYASSPVWLVHWSAFLVTLAVVLTLGAHAALRDGRVALGVPSLRLAALGAGQVLGVLYAVLEALHLGVLAVSPTADPRLLAATERAALTSAVLLVASGLLAGLAVELVADLAARRRLWQLWPVWADLRPVDPTDPDGFPGRVRTTLARGARPRQLRVVAEIGDAVRVLAPHVPSHDPHDPVAQAAALQLAAHRRTPGPERQAPAEPRRPGAARTQKSGAVRAGQAGAVRAGGAGAARAGGPGAPWEADAVRVRQSGGVQAREADAVRTRELQVLARAWPRAAAVRAQVVRAADAPGQLTVPGDAGGAVVAPDPGAPRPDGPVHESSRSARQQLERLRWHTPSPHHGGAERAQQATRSATEPRAGTLTHHPRTPVTRQLGTHVPPGPGAQTRSGSGTHGPSATHTPSGTGTHASPGPHRSPRTT